jgi:hypothetical protein
MDFSYQDVYNLIQVFVTIVHLIIDHLMEDVLNLLLLVLIIILMDNVFYVQMDINFYKDFVFYRTQLQLFKTVLSLINMDVFNVILDII